jgi:peptidyl-dipeptidase Dcp
MDWHTLPFEGDVMPLKRLQWIASGSSTKFFHDTGTYFAHIFSGGYSAGYYVYMWAEVLDADAFAAFKESDKLFDPELAARFRHS